MVLLLVSLYSVPSVVTLHSEAEVMESSQLWEQEMIPFFTCIFLLHCRFTSTKLWILLFCCWGYLYNANNVWNIWTGKQTQSLLTDQIKWSKSISLHVGCFGSWETFFEKKSGERSTRFFSRLNLIKLNALSLPFRPSLLMLASRYQLSLSQTNIPEWTTVGFSQCKVTATITRSFIAETHCTNPEWKPVDSIWLQAQFGQLLTVCIWWILTKTFFYVWKNCDHEFYPHNHSLTIKNILISQKINPIPQIFQTLNEILIMNVYIVETSNQQCLLWKWSNLQCLCIISAKISSPVESNHSEQRVIFGKCWSWE